MVYFVIPVYNTEKYLDRCMRSVLSQTRNDFVIILVNDGSTDGSAEICDRYEREYENVVCIHKQNGGLSSARNEGIEYALKQAKEHDYITFIDSDDFIRENYAERLVYLCDTFAADIAQPMYEKGGGDSFSRGTGKTAGVFCASGNDALLGYRLKSQSTPKLYRIHLFEDIRFPDGVWNEDEFVTYKVVHKAINVVFTEEKLYYYYQHRGSIMSDIARRLKNNPHKHDWICAYDERIRYFKEFGSKEQVLKTHEKICTDIILRYCEQKRLPKKYRDLKTGGREAVEMYRAHYKIMIKRTHIPLKRRLIYLAFYMCPWSAVMASKIFTLRK